MIGVICGESMGHVVNTPQNDANRHYQTARKPVTL